MNILKAFIFSFIMTISSCNQSIDVEKGAQAKVDVNLDSISLTGSSNSIIEFGEVLLGNKVSKLISISKGGRFPAFNLVMNTLEGIDSGEFAYTGLKYPGTAGTCGTELASGLDSCLIEVEFNASSEGIFSKNFNVSYNDGLEDKKITLKFRGSAGNRASIEFENTNGFSFGLVEPPFSRTIIAKITNNGGIVARDISSSFTGTGNVYFTGGSFPGINGNCSNMLNSKQSCFLEIEMNQGATEGRFSSILNLSYTDQSNVIKEEALSFSVNINEFIADVKLFDTDSSYDFGNVLWTRQREQRVTYINRGYATATINSINLSDALNFKVDSSRSTCVSQKQLGISQKCDLYIVFTSPEGDVLSGIGGSFSTNLSIDYNNSKQNLSHQVPINFSANGLIPGVVVLNQPEDISNSSLESFTFNRIGIFEQERQVFTMKNIGQAPVSSLRILGSNLKRFSLSVADPSTQVSEVCTTQSTSIDPNCYTGFSLVSNECGQTLQAGNSCNFTIQYLPRFVGAFDNKLGDGGFASRALIEYSSDPSSSVRDSSHRFSLSGASFNKPNLQWYENINDVNPIGRYSFQRIFENGDYFNDDGSINTQFRKILWLRNIGPSTAYDIDIVRDLRQGQLSSPANRVIHYVNSTPVDIFQSSSNYVSGGLCSNYLLSGDSCFIEVEVRTSDVAAADPSIATPYLPFGSYRSSIVLNYSDNQIGALTPSGAPFYTVELDLNASVRQLGTFSLSQSRFVSVTSPGGTSTRRFTFRNFGDFRVSNVSFQFSNTEGSDFSERESVNLSGRSLLSCTSRSFVGECFRDISFSPQDATASVSLPTSDARNKADILTVNFFNGIFQDSVSFIIEGRPDESAGHLIIDLPGENKNEIWSNGSTGYLFTGNFVQGLAKDVSLNFKNIGLGEASNIVIRGDGVDVRSDTLACTTTRANFRDVRISNIAPESSCNIILSFTSNSSSYRNNVIFFYNNRDGIRESVSVNFSGRALSPSRLIASLGNVDFRRVVTGESKDLRVQFRNVGEFPFVFNSSTAHFINGSNSTGEFTFFESSCPSSIPRNVSCELTFTFSPPADSPIGTNYSGEFEILYTTNGTAVNDGSVKVDLVGQSAPENSIFSGWTQIKSIGRVEAVGSSVLSEPSVSLSWNSILLDASYTPGPIHIYRSIDDRNSINLDNPYAIITDYNQTSFNDTTDVKSSTKYFYKVVPTVIAVGGSHIPSDHNDPDSIIEIDTPELNMALVHKWMLNKQICQMSNKNFSRFSNYGCNLSGAGTNGSRIERESFQIDLFEAGVRKVEDLDTIALDQTRVDLISTIAGNTPVELDRSHARDYCISKGGKRLPTKLEFTQAALWTEEDYSLGASNNQVFTDKDCNVDYSASGSVLKLAGESDNCQSRYGVFDLVGNLAEFSSETLSAGTDLLSEDLKSDSFFYNNTTSDKLFSLKSADCFNFAVGMHKPSSNSSLCDEKSIDIQADSVKQYFTSGDKVIVPLDGFPSSGSFLFMPLLGGSYNENFGGPFSTSWKLFAFEDEIKAGFRCVKDIP